MERFIVLADARSGTHYFESILDQHPQIKCFNEIFSGLHAHHFFPFLLERIKQDQHLIIPVNWPKIFEDYLSARCREFSAFTALGMDIKYYQTAWVHNLFGVLRQSRFKVIHLIRKNVLKHHIAWLFHTMREKLGRGFHEKTKVKPEKIHLETDTLIQELARRCETINHFRNILKDFDHIEVYYEDCFDNPELISQTMTPHVFDQVYDFLNIENRRYDLETAYVKTNPGLLSELITNYDDVVAHLSGTPWEFLLKDTIGENIKSAEELNEEGERLAKEGFIQAALEIFKKTVKLEPNFAMGYNNIGVVSYQNGDYPGAIENFEKACNLKADSLFRENYDEARAALKQNE